MSALTVVPARRCSRDMCGWRSTHVCVDLESKSRVSNSRNVQCKGAVILERCVYPSQPGLAPKGFLMREDDAGPLPFLAAWIGCSASQRSSALNASMALSRL
jgi:hypothetical protein